MKKLILVILVIFTLSQCNQKKPKGINNSKPISSLNNNTSGIYYYERSNGDIKYGIVTTIQGGIYIINLTKDELEVEVLRNKLENKKY